MTVDSPLDMRALLARGCTFPTGRRSLWRRSLNFRIDVDDAPDDEDTVPLTLNLISIPKKEKAMVKSKLSQRH